MREQDKSLSEVFRLAALDWVDKDAAARLREELKTAFLEKKKNDLGEMPDSHAERIVKASPEWKRFIIEMVEARTEANRAKVQMEYVRTKLWEQHSSEATRRAEMRIS